MCPKQKKYVLTLPNMQRNLIFNLTCVVGACVIKKANDTLLKNVWMLLKWVRSKLLVVHITLV